MVRLGWLGLGLLAGIVLADEGAVANVASAPAARTVNGLKSFDEIIKGAQRTDGVIPLWQRDDKFWLEIPPALLGQRLLLAPKIKQGMSEGGWYGGAMLAVREVEFQRIHQQIQLLARNSQYDHAQNQTLPIHAAYSPSLIGSAAIVSQPHPQRKSVLVEAHALLGGDWVGTASALNRRYRQNYALDLRNSAILAARAGSDALVLEVRQHFFSANLQSATGSAPAPTSPRYLPDPRSLFLTFHFTLQALPEVPMRPRLADQRLGHFTSRVMHLADERARTPLRHYVNRWRLEKKDPTAALSEPTKPIVFWLDPSIPAPQRQAVREGILEWNKAFERIGFRDAIVVREADAQLDTLDVGYASVRWIADAGLSFSAIGPVQTDPRTGEILDADIAISALSLRNRRAYVQDRQGGAENYAAMIESQLAYATEVLAARGELSDEALQQYLFDGLKSLTLHEVGHTLGLRHNFRASRLYSAAQLADPVFSRTHGLAGSIMDYLPVNLPEPGQARPAPFQTVLGPYDFWAIEYAYAPFTPETEQAQLQKIAARSAEPELAFATDEDVYQGSDPEVLQGDLGSDPLAFARSRIAIAKALIARQGQRVFREGEDYIDQRRSLMLAFGDLQLATSILARQLGAVRTLRDLPASGRDPVQALDAASQRAALALLAQEILAADSFNIPPALLRQASIDYLERGDLWFSGEGLSSPGLSLPALSLQVQKIVLDRVFSDAVLTQVLDSQMVRGQGDGLGLPEMWRRIEQAIWSELARGGDIPVLRRELQREYLQRVTSLLIKPAHLRRADAQALLRAQARALLKQLNLATRRNGRHAETMAHLQDCRDQLQEALSARMVRANP